MKAPAPLWTLDAPGEDLLRDAFLVPCSSLAAYGTAIETILELLKVQGYDMHTHVQVRSLDAPLRTSAQLGTFQFSGGFAAGRQWGVPSRTTARTQLV